MTPKVRQVLYSVGVLAFAGLTVLSTFKVIEPDTAANVSAALTSVLGLFGVTGFGVAASAVTKQINKGAFDDVPPADQVINGVQSVIAQAQNAQAEVERVREAVTAAVADVPALGPLARQALDSLPG